MLKHQVGRGGTQKPRNLEFQCRLTFRLGGAKKPRNVVMRSSDLSRKTAKLMLAKMIEMVFGNTFHNELQHGFQIFRSVALRVISHLLGRSSSDDHSAAIASFWPHVHDPVGGLDDIQIVFNDHDGIAGVA